jgi:ATP-binding cassette, subfamily C, bacterial PrsD
MAANSVTGRGLGVLGVSGLSATALAVFSIASNVLMLTGPLFMLQIYDRVLASRSIPTLIALSLLVVVLYGLYAVVEIVRARMSARTAAVFEERLAPAAFAASVRLRLRPDLDVRDPVRSLDTIRSFIAGPAPVALLDLPWAPAYVVIVYAFHPLLGAVAAGGAILIGSILAISEWRSRSVSRQLTDASRRRQVESDDAGRNAEVMLAMGMLPAALRRWLRNNRNYGEAQLRGADQTAIYAASTKSSRLLLQSAVLAVGAFLVIEGQLQAGLMIAASIITARALAPVELLVGQWRHFVAARQAAMSLNTALAAVETEPRTLKLPLPSDRLNVTQLATGPTPSGPTTVTGINFAISAGDGLGILGSSGSGKSSLARALVGAWPALAGSVRLDGSELIHFDPEVLGHAVGYLPQAVELFDGTIAENISRFADDANVEDIIAAARAASVHELIAGLPNGYETRVGEAGTRLSGGQRQRIGLARALYRNPFLLVLDEPNANLDAEGEKALQEAIADARARGAIVIVVAHRPSAISMVDKLLFLRNGEQIAFGAKDDVLSAISPKNVRRVDTAEKRIANAR